MVLFIKCIMRNIVLSSIMLIHWCCRSLKKNKKFDLSSSFFFLGGWGGRQLLPSDFLHDQSLSRLSMTADRLNFDLNKKGWGHLTCWDLITLGFLYFHGYVQPCFDLSFESIALTSWIKAAGQKNFYGIPVISKRAGKVSSSFLVNQRRREEGGLHCPFPLISH